MSFFKSFALYSYVILIGCASTSAKTDTELLRDHQSQCDKELATNSYDISCDRYLNLSSKPQFITDPKISEVRKIYILKRNEDIQRKLDERHAAWNSHITETKRILNNTYSKASLSKLNEKDLCLHFWTLKHESYDIDKSPFIKKVEDELKRRGFKSNQITNARDGDISIGSPTCVMYAALGPPSDENRTVTIQSIRIQHVYRSRRLYIYSVNGSITSWQDTID